MYQSPIAQELWSETSNLLRRQRFELIVRTPAGDYWSRRKDRAYVLVSIKSNGEPKIERLDR